MTSTTPSFGPEDTKHLIDLLIKGVEDGTKMAAHILWSALMSFLKDHWLAVMGGLFVVFVIVTFKAMLGRWGSLGSFLYNFFYFGILLVVGLIWGPEVFLGDFFKAACTIILYPVCYFIVGLILDKMGVKRRI